jgi:tetratricopeptide (TPR) repeat protein
VAALAVGAAPLAVEFCRRAARRAAGLAARDVAVRMLELAAEAAPLVEDVCLAFDVLLELGDAQGRAGRAAEARDTFLKVAERAGPLDLPTYLARAALGFGGRYVWTRAAQRSPEVEMCERALEVLPAEERGLRARLLARLVGMQRDRRLLPRHRSRVREAVELGRASGDYEALAQALNARAFCDLDDAERALASIDELQAVALQAGDIERDMQAHDYRVIALLKRGEVAAAEAEAATSGRLAERLAQPNQSWFAHTARALMALLRGELERAERAAREARRVGMSAQTRESRSVEAVQMHHILREQRRLEEHAAAAAEVAEALPTFAVLRCVCAHLSAEIGRTEQAYTFLEAQLGSGFADIQDMLHYDYALSLCAEMAERLGHRAAAEALVPLLAEVSQPFVVAPACVFVGSVERYRALAAATLGRWQEAAHGLRRAAQQNRAAGASLYALRCDFDRARILLGAADAPAEALAEAGALLRDVEREAERGGFVDLLLGARALRGGAAAVTAPAFVSGEAPELRRIGEFWNMRWGGRAIQLADAKGVRYVAELLARPGQELGAMELLTGGELPVGEAAEMAEPLTSLRVGMGSLGPAIDGVARAAYQRRLDELAAATARAEAAGDRARAERARHEQLAIEEELGAATGLGGRARQTGDITERARQSVTKAIKSVLKRIGREHEELGRHLEATVRTGLFCRYEPDAAAAVTWRVEL